MSSARRDLKTRPEPGGHGLLVLIVSQDAIFAEKIGKTLEQWRLTFQHLSPEAEFKLQEHEPDVLLFDIRELSKEALALLRSIRQRLPRVALVLINRADNVTASIAGMKAGATNEIIVPFDTESLKGIIIEAYEEGQRGRKKKRKKPFLTRFSEAMMAATFAEAGEFDSALDLLATPEPRPTSTFAFKQRKGRE